MTGYSSLNLKQLPKVIHVLLLGALWALSRIPGLGMKAQFQGLLSQIVETLSGTVETQNFKDFPSFLLT